jgi:FkbH-like protein
LRTLADELNLGLESFIFVDDNPLECAEVRAGCPQVVVLELPADAREIAPLLDREWAFDQLKVTGEDQKRTQLYKENKARERLKSEALTYEQFIEGLELEIEIAPPQAGQIERLSQLTQRTNQFNTTTIRRNESEVQEKESRVVDVRDRFGAYGLVGAFFYEMRGDVLHVDSFMLSCRALGRGVAERMLAWLGSEAQRLGLTYVDVLYVPSARNRPALEFLEAVGKEYQRDEGTASVFHYPAEVCTHLTELVLARTGTGELETPAKAASAAENLASIKPVGRELHEVSAIEQAVRTWKPGRVRGPAEYVAPRTDTERTLAGIWEQVLNLQHVGIYDNFFDLGGHSLLVTQVVSRVRNTCRLELPFDALFKRQTIAEIAGYLDELQRVEGPLLLPVARPVQIPLSFAQQRLWFIDQMAAGNVAYNIFNALRLRGSLDVEALARGFRQVVQRHESLRTTFQAVDGQPYQRIVPNLDVKLQMLDISTLADTERESAAQRLAREEGRLPFDLSNGPLVRCTLLKLAGDEHVLLLNMHHIVSDGWSMGIFFRELMAFALSGSDGESGPLQPLPLQYADFALWQRSWLQGKELERQVEYWRKQLGDAPDRLALPADYARPEVQAYRGGRLYFKLNKELSTGLHTLSRREGATLFMTLLAGFDALLWRYSGQTDIVVGSPVANRSRAELEGLIGFFANNLVLRARLSGDMRFSELLSQIKETCLRAYQHQDLPFEKLVDELQPKRDLSRNPLFQVMFILQNTPLEDLAVSGLMVESLDVEPDAAQFDLRMSLRDMPAGLSGYLEYNTDLFDAETIGLLADLYEHILMGWVDETKQALREIEAPAALLARMRVAQAREQRQGFRVRREPGDVVAIEQAVRAWKPGQVHVLAEYVAPRTEMEKTLAEIWNQVLNLEQVGIHDNFFDLGGHSLLITQVISRIRNTCQVELPFDVLFRRQTIAEIAEYLDGVRGVQYLKTSSEFAGTDRDDGEL